MGIKYPSRYLLCGSFYLSDQSYKFISYKRKLNDSDPVLDNLLTDVCTKLSDIRHICEMAKIL